MCNVLSSSTAQGGLQETAEVTMTETISNTTVKLGQPVEYISTRGKSKLAFVTATPETVAEGTSVPELSEGQVHLMVVGILTGTSPRLNVPSAASVEGNDDFVNGDGAQVGVWRPIA
jgi:hypothetical protein